MVQAVKIFYDAPKSKVPFLACLGPPRGVKTLTYISQTNFFVLRIFPRIFLLYTILGSDDE